MEQLELCPFCGGEAEIRRPIYTKPGTPVEVLLNCKTCYMGLSEPMDEVAAISAWNRRAPSEGDSVHAGYEEGYKDGYREASGYSNTDDEGYKGLGV